MKVDVDYKNIETRLKLYELRAGNCFKLLTGETAWVYMKIEQTESTKAIGLIGIRLVDGAPLYMNTQDVLVRFMEHATISY